MHSALTGFGDDAALRANMLTAPLRVGLCLRTVAGRRLTPQQLTLPVPNATAPDLVLRSYTIYENGAAATVEIMGRRHAADGKRGKDRESGDLFPT